MAIVSGVASIAAIGDFIAEAGTFATVLDALSAGVITETGTGIFVVVEGGAGTAIATTTATALEVAETANLAATATQVGTAGLTLAETQGGFSLVAMGSMSLPAVAAAVAPFAGAAIGATLYESNPELWTKISQKLLPFCYPGTDQIPTWMEIVESTGAWRVLVETGIIEAIKQLFADEDVKPEGGVVIESPYGTISLSPSNNSVPRAGYEPYRKVSGVGNHIAVLEGDTYHAYFNDAVSYASTHPLEPPAYFGFSSGWNQFSTSYTTAVNAINNISTLTLSELRRIINGETSQYPVSATAGIEPWGGVSAPTVPETIPIIVVPEPLGPDYRPITTPATPITPPALPPHVDPLPLPAPAPDPEVDPPPENWPEEEPWPTTVPFPWTPPETDPEPEQWPEYIPWPLPTKEPDEWPTTPEVPTEWPEPFPSTEPWPRTPEDWPEEVPWPENPPEEWPEEVPWPAGPDDWPEEVPWPTPWPDNWPDDQPWPIPWPDEIPYPIPWKWPTPTPTPDPYAEPGKIGDPDTEVQPYIDPIPWPYNPLDPSPSPRPDNPTQPTPTPDPTRDPSQPQPTPEPDPDPTPEPDPTQPSPPPPSGDITPPPLPYVPLPFSSTTGLITVYHPDQSTLLAFCNWLWVTWQDATIDKIWNNPFDGVITLFELYCTPTDVDTKTIRSGFLDSQISSPVISRYTEIDCGSLGIPEYYGNYLDYAPYTKAYIYLPFIGVVELNADDIVGHGVNVTYKIDEYNGSCIAMITVAKVTEVNGEQVEYNNVFYQYSGNCAVELPIAGGSQAAIKAGMIEAAAWGIGSVIGGVMSGSSIGEIGANMAYGAASAVHSVVSAKSSVQHSGSFGSSYGALGAKKPFITVVRPKQLQIANYNELYGYQAHKAVRIGSCTGYLRCREVHVISPTASDDEKAKIEELLKTGVYVTE